MGSTTIYDFLLLQPEGHLNDLYRNEWCALAVFQSLDALSRLLIMRLLFINQTVFSYQLLVEFTSRQEHSLDAIRASYERLRLLRIVGSSGNSMAFSMHGFSRTEDTFAINAHFQASLQRAVLSSARSPWEKETRVLPPLRHVPQPNEVEMHATAQWNTVLHFLVGKGDTDAPSPKVIELLVSTGLLAPGDAGDDGREDALPVAERGPGEPALSFDEIMSRGANTVSITRSGYEFLLRDTAVQLWTFVHAYIESSGSRGIRSVDVLEFILELGFCTAGSGYALSGLSETQRSLLSDFESLGLVYVPHEQHPLPAPHAEVDALAAAQAAGASLGHVTPQSALTAITTLLQHGLIAPAPVPGDEASPSSPGVLALASRWLWPLLRAVPPLDGSEVEDDVALARPAQRTASSPALAPPSTNSGWEVLEGDMDVDAVMLPSAAHSAAYHAESVASAPPSHRELSPPAAKEFLAPSLGVKTRLPCPEGSWSLVDATHCRLRDDLTWVSGNAEAAAEAPAPCAATRVLGGALHDRISADLHLRNRSREEHDHRRFYPSSLAVLLTRPPNSGGDARARPEAPSVHSSATPMAAATQGSAAFQALASSAAVIRASRSDHHLYVVVEKNFRVYAYTSNDLHLALLALFCKVEMRMPDVVVASLTRRSVLSAMQKGMGAALIAHFLEARVHPSVAAQGLGLPENVKDQLFLWERELRRIIFRPAHLMTDFGNLRTFAESSAHASDLGGALYDPAPRLLADIPACKAIVEASLRASPTAAALTSVWTQAVPERDEAQRLSRAVLVVTSAQLESFRKFFERHKPTTDPRAAQF